MKPTPLPGRAGEYAADDVAGEQADLEAGDGLTWRDAGSGS